MKIRIKTLLIWFAFLSVLSFFCYERYHFDLRIQQAKEVGFQEAWEEQAEDFYYENITTTLVILGRYKTRSREEFSELADDYLRESLVRLFYLSQKYQRPASKQSTEDGFTLTVLSSKQRAYRNAGMVSRILNQKDPDRFVVTDQMKEMAIRLFSSSQSEFDDSAIEKRLHDFCVDAGHLGKCDLILPMLVSPAPGQIATPDLVLQFGRSWLHLKKREIKDDTIPIAFLDALKRLPKDYQEEKDEIFLRLKELSPESF